MTKATSHFQQGGASYASFRPTYPAELFKQLYKACHSFEVAVDVGCGSGQFSTPLAEQFVTVIGVDTSVNQLANANAANVNFKQGNAENLPIAAQSADLIVSAQAAHWFDLPTFYKEVRRIAKPNAVIALLGYGVPVIEGEVNVHLQHAYWKLLKGFWPAERSHIEQEYRSLNFEFEEIPFQSMALHKTVNKAEFLGYLNTWSAVKQFNKTGRNFEAELTELMGNSWQNAEATKRLSWPIFGRLGRCK